MLGSQTGGGREDRLMSRAWSSVVGWGSREMRKRLG